MSAFAVTPNQSAMRHGGSFLAIFALAWAGLLLAGAVYTLEPPKLPANSAPPMTFLAANEFEAVSFIEDGTNAATAPSDPPARNDEQAVQLFGMETEPVVAGELPENGTTSRRRWLKISRWLRNAMQMAPALSPRKD